VRVHAFVASLAVLTVNVTVMGEPDPLEVTQTQATCQRLDATTDVCTVTDGLTWVEVLRCNQMFCERVERYELW
jgi:hypothetical protein